MASVSEHDSLLFLQELYDEGGYIGVMEYMLENTPHFPEAYSKNIAFVDEIKTLDYYIAIQYTAAREKEKYLSGYSSLLIDDLPLYRKGEEELVYESEQIHIKNDDVDITLSFNYEGQTLSVSSDNKLINRFFIDVLNDYEEYDYYFDFISRRFPFKIISTYFESYDGSNDREIVKSILADIRDYKIIIDEYSGINYEKLGG